MAIQLKIDKPVIDEIFRPLNQCTLPGAAVGIAVDGKPVYREAFGLASMDLPIALTTATRMRIGSTTKHFTALLWLLLCEEGLADLDESIDRYLPELTVAARGVTVRQLLTHTSGLRDAFDISWHFNGTGRRVTAEELLRFYCRATQTNHAPGQHWIYNNGAYLIVSAAIERITGRTLEQELHERIFMPIGMHDTTLRRWDSDFLPDSASLHMLSSAGVFERSYLGTAGMGQGGIASTVNDMLRWLSHMAEPTVGSPATWKEMMRVHTLLNGQSTEYGLGLRFNHYRGVRLISHSGGVMGGNCQMLKAPDVGLDIIVILNRSDVFGVNLADRIMDACLVGLSPLSKPGNTVQVSGVFQAESGRILSLTPGERNVVAAIDGFEIPMDADPDGILRPTGIIQQKNQYIMVPPNVSAPREICLVEFGVEETFQRIEQTREGASAPVGRYHAELEAVEAHVMENKDSNVVQLRTSGHHGSALYNLSYIGGHAWRARAVQGSFPPGGVLSFSPDRSAFSFTTFRTRGLQFHRLHLG